MRWRSGETGLGLADRTQDIAVTLICWLYFTLGFLLFFLPFYLAAFFFSSRREEAFQRYNRNFYWGFITLLRRLTPRQQWSIDPRIASLRSAVIVCNHRSYLDPLLLIALLDRCKTVVKPIFFSLPLFAWVIRTAGYFPASAQGRWAGLMLTQMERMAAYLGDGGNLFIFPEGTRSRDGGIGVLNKGALKIARQCRAPVYVLCLRATDRLFRPGTFFFSTRRPIHISIHIIDHIPPLRDADSLTELTHRIRTALESCQEGEPQETLSNNPSNGA